jgi:hypothetical protein
VTPPHPTLAASLAVSMGDPTKVSLSSSWRMVMHQEVPVLWESAQEMPKEGSAQEAPMQVWEVLMMQTQEVPMTQV